MNELRYRIINRIDIGGMAEVFKAVNSDTGELLAIKRMLPEICENDEFVRMFVNEAKIALLLRHPSIVNTYMLGKDGERYFIAMEYVDGINLKRVLNYFNNTGTMPDLGLVLNIVLRIARGLAYAHELKDRYGKSLHIVHRDISPPNILLSHRGDVKIADFGLVKSKEQLNRTVPGLIKGKFSYLSPEAAYGEKIDERSDIYSLGIIMWELLTTQPLFFDPVEPAILDKVRKSMIPSVKNYRTDIPPHVILYLNKALKRERDSRWNSARDFADALEQFMTDANVPVDSTPVSQCVNKILQYDAEMRERSSKPPTTPPAEGVSEDTTSVSLLIPIDVFREEIENDAQKAESRSSSVKRINRKYNLDLWLLLFLIVAALLTTLIFW